MEKELVPEDEEKAKAFLSSLSEAVNFDSAAAGTDKLYFNPFYVAETMSATLSDPIKLMDDKIVRKISTFSRDRKITYEDALNAIGNVLQESKEPSARKETCIEAKRDLQARIRERSSE